MEKLIVYTENYIYGGLEKLLFDFLKHYPQENILLLYNAGNERIREFAIKNKIKFKELNIKSAKFSEKNTSLVDKIKNTILFFTSKYFDFLYNLIFQYFLLRKLPDYKKILIINGGYPAADSCRTIAIAAKLNHFKNIILSVLSYPVRSTWIPIFVFIEHILDYIFIHCVHFIHAICTDTKNGLVRHHHFNPKKIVVINSGIEMEGKFELRKNFDINGQLILKKEEEIWLGVISAIRPAKGHRFLIEAMNVLSKKYPNLKCLIVGEGETRIKLMKYTTRLNLDKSIIFTGKYNGNLSNVYNFIDIFVFPTLIEGLPYCIMEAMSYHLPVISTNVGGIPDLIKNDINGYLIPSKNVSELVEKIEHLINDPNLRKKMGENGVQLYNSNFRLPIFIRKMKQLVEKKEFY